jgi:sulfate-transporting ATPase
VELFDELTVRENLLTAIDRHGWVEFARDPFRPGQLPTSQMMETVVEEFGLAEHLEAMPSALPQGTRRLVGIARAMLAEPAVLFLDEPAAGLDHTESEEFGRLVRRIAENYGIAVVLVEHDVPLVMAVCDHIVVLDFGRKIAEGSPEEIRNDPQVVAAYLGEPATAGA